jgi:hypothetical protein
VAVSAPEHPRSDEYQSAYERYVALVPKGDILESLERQREQLLALVRSIPGEKEEFRYAPDKWSMREVVGHVIDAERIFGYRALCIARGETKSLPGFQENDYARNSEAGGISLSQLAEEFGHVRSSHIHLFRRLRPAEWLRLGTADGHPISVRALAYIIAGHAAHHEGILRERYL